VVDEVAGEGTAEEGDGQGKQGDRQACLGAVEKTEADQEGSG